MRDDQVPAKLSEASKRRIAGRNEKRNKQFVKGPIPVPWLAEAAKLPGKTLVVGVLLWFKGGMNGYDRIRLSADDLSRFGIERKAASRALGRLEQSGLIRLDKSPGKRPTASIVHSRHAAEE